MVSVIPLLVMAGLSFQSPVQTAASQTEPVPVLTPEVRGDIMVARKMYREAIDFYKTGADTNAVLANKTGIAYHQLGELENAKKYYQRSAKLKPDYSQAINNLGTIYYAEKSYRRAISQYKKALAITPKSASVLGNLGLALFARKQYDQGQSFIEQAVAIDPDIFEQRSNQGVLVQERSVEERAKYYYVLAKTYAKAQMTDRTLQCIRHALEQGFKEPQKFTQEPEFAYLKDNAEFQEILAAEHKVL